MVQGDEQYARVRHQSLFLHSRGLTSPEMTELKRQLRLRERFVGKDASRLDPHVLDRFHDALGKTAMEQLKATGLVEEWLESWEAGSDVANVPAPAPTQESASPPPLSSENESTANVDGTPARRYLSDALAQLEHAVQLFSEHVADFELRTKHARAHERI